MQLARIEHEFAKFHSSIKRLSSCGYRLREEIDNGYVIMPSGSDELLLTLMAVTHGDEVAGLAVLNEVVEFLLAGFAPLRGGLALLLGNYPAVLRGKRYVQRDLNRSFALQEVAAEMGEAERARSLAKVLQRTKFFIDFHQTTARSTSCFGIFPFQRRSLAFAQLVQCEQPVVTRFGSRFSQDGMCSDEFVQEQGNVGITIELGQKGFDPTQIAQGVLIALRALRCVKATVSLDSVAVTTPLYTFGQIITFPASGDVCLVEGLYNFKKVASGERLGMIDGEAVVAEEDGVVLFPKYKFDRQRPPHELCHILRKIAVEDLPQE